MRAFAPKPVSLDATLTRPPHTAGTSAGGRAVDRLAPPVVRAPGEVAAAGGRPLDPASRDLLERRFAHDFSRVRVHADAAAAASARAMYAQAYTFGRHIVFGPGMYAPHTAAGRRLLDHELTHVVQQERGASAPAGALEGQAEVAVRTGVPAALAGVLTGPALTLHAPRVQCQGDHAAMQARLRQVQARLAELRARQQRLTDEFTDSAARERQRESLRRGTEQAHEQSRTESAAPALLGGRVTIARMRRAVTVAQSGSDVILSVALQLTYLALPDARARQQAAADIPRIEAAIRDVWQVSIATGEYAGVNLRLAPSVTFLPRGTPRSDTAFLIEVRGPDGDPSLGDGLQGLISLAQAHLQGSEVIVVAHELAHLFGFMDTYLTMTSRGPRGEKIERWVVGRVDPNRSDLLGLIGPAQLRRLQGRGAISAEDVARQSRPVHVWEEEASTLLRAFGVAPPAPARPTPDSEEFDPAVELERDRREGEARVRPIRERRGRAESSIEWLDTVEEIMRLEAEERQLPQRLQPAAPSP